MEKFLTDKFFDLTTFSHKTLFEKGKNAWDAISYLEVFFTHFPLGKIESEVPDGVTFVNLEQISIGKDTVIDPGVMIKGPCVIGENCEIRQGAFVREKTVIGDRCVIGHGSEIKRSIFLDDASAAHFNYVGDSILGNRVNLGAGVKLANSRLDKELIYFRYLGKKISTNLYKLGAVLGDDVQMGCNSVANPGTIIGKKVVCPPCKSVGGYIPPLAKIKSTGEVICQ